MRGMRRLLPFVLWSALALGQGLAVHRLSPPAAARPGELVVHVWRIANRSPAPLRIQVRPELPPGWEALGLPEALVLGPGEEDFLFLTLHLPRTASRGAYTVRLRLHGDGEEAVAEAPVEVEAVAALALEAPPSQAAPPGETLTFVLRVVNQGNALDRAGLEVRTASGWRVEVRPGELPLAPGEAGEVRVSVAIPGAARPGREVVLATARSGLAPAVEARTAWYIEVLPPGPERVPVQLYAELAMEGRARLAYEFLAGSGTSFLGVAGRGAVLEGALELSARWAGPWAPQPFQLLDLQAAYVTDAVRVQAGRVSLALNSLLSGLGFWGVGAELSLAGVGLALGAGWEGEQGRAGGRVDLRGAWGEAGGAYREERGSGLHRQAGAVWLSLRVLEGVRFRAEGGAARVHGLTRFAGEMRLTWELPELFLLEARAYAVDPGFPALTPDRAGFLVSGRLGTEEAGFRFAGEWQREDLRGLSPAPRAWQGVQAGWDFFPEGVPLRLGLALALRRAAALALPPSADERTARAEALAAFALAGFTLGAQGAYTRLFDFVSRRSSARLEFREWLHLRFSPRVSAALEFRQARFSTPEEERVQDEATFTLAVEEGLWLSWGYGRGGGVARAEVVLQPAGALTLRLGAEARWGEGAQPVRLGAFLEFAYGFAWAPPFLPAFGALSGVVFADRNGNGRRDPGEPGLPGAVLALDDLQVATGKEGEFRFPGRPPGTYRVRVARAPAGYAAPTPEFPVALAPGQRTELLLPLLPLAGLSGGVFLDQDGDGVRGPGEPGLARAYVRILSADGRAVEVLTDAAGRFAWPELLPGRYRVELVGEALPPRHEPTTPASLELELAPGERKEVAFGVRERPRPVIVIQPPLAEFTWAPLVPRAGEPVLFDGSPSQAFHGAAIVEYLWDFDDDGVADAEGVRVTWAFPAPGLYLVSLTVVDSAGLTGRTQYPLEVRP